MSGFGLLQRFVCIKALVRGSLSVTRARVGVDGRQVVRVDCLTDGCCRVSTEHGWVYLNAIIDCCTREIVGWSLELRCRAAEATAVIKQAVDEQQILPGTLTLKP